MTINVLLADDQALVRGALATLLGLEPDIEVVAQVGTGPQAVDAVRTSGADVALLDIDMPDIDGIIFSKQHRNYRIVFVTNYDTRIKETFGPNVYGYVSKGNLEEELVEKVKEVIEVIKCDYYVTFKVNGIDINIRVDDIIYCQYLGNHIVSIVYHDKKININNSSLKKVKEVLNEYFIEISQDIIINKHRIINFEDRYVYLDGINSKFEVSVRKRKLVRKSFYETFR